MPSTIVAGAFIVVIQAIFIGIHIVNLDHYWQQQKYDRPAPEFTAFGLLWALVIGMGTGLPGLLTATIGFVKTRGQAKLVALFGGLLLYMAASFIPYFWR
ncbi:MAG: hypothetical protein EOP83_20780 [Verrucomicrobiaceae bacterium]|nr:MAG: hypothetical protein EOP83_20780 [Verrucomicrobiaceae bacterium]